MVETVREYEDIARDIEGIISTLLIESPFYGFLLSKLPVYVTSEVETAATDGRAIYVNPEFWRSLGDREKTAVLIHELEHVARLHPFRLRALSKALGAPLRNVAPIFNVASDSVINEDLKASGFRLPSGAITYDTVRRYFGFDPAGLSSEEITARIVKQARRASGQAGHGQAGGAVGQAQGQASGQGGRETGGQAGAGRAQAEAEGSRAGGVEGQGTAPSQAAGGGSQAGGGGLEEAAAEAEGVLGRTATGEDVMPAGEGPRGVKVKEGDREFEKTVEEAVRRGDYKAFRDAVKSAVVDSYMAAKHAGSAPGHMDRVIDSLLKPEIDWRELIRSTLREALGGRVRRTWGRVNRKLPLLRPGKTTLGAGDVIALPDVSGSISQEELRKMLSEIAGIAAQLSAKVKVIPWDAEAKGVFEVRRPREVAEIPLRGGGGTVLTPALEVAEREIRLPRTPVVVLSDWFIDDERRARRKLEELSRKAELILVTVKPQGREPPEIRRAKRLAVKVS